MDNIDPGSAVCGGGTVSCAAAPMVFITEITTLAISIICLVAIKFDALNYPDSSKTFMKVLAILAIIGASIGIITSTCMCCCGAGCCTGGMACAAAQPD